MDSALSMLCQSFTGLAHMHLLATEVMSTLLLCSLAACLQVWAQSMPLHQVSFYWAFGLGPATAAYFPAVSLGVAVPYGQPIHHIAVGLGFTWYGCVEPFVPLAACIIAAVLFIVERQSRICSPGISHLTDSPSPHHGQGLIGDLAVC